MAKTYPWYLHGFFLSLNDLWTGSHLSSSCNISWSQSGLFLVGGSYWGGYKESMGSLTIFISDLVTKGPSKISISSFFSRGGGGVRSLSFPRETSSSNVTSLLILTFFWLGIYILNSLECSQYPKNVHFLPVASNLFLLSFGTWNYMGKPNIRRWKTSILTPMNTSSWVLLSNA